MLPGDSPENAPNLADKSSNLSSLFLLSDHAQPHKKRGRKTIETRRRSQVSPLDVAGDVARRGGAGDGGRKRERRDGEER